MIKHLEKQPPYIIFIPAGMELNGGTHEDGETYKVTSRVKALVTGPLVDNALPIQLLENGKPVGPPLFFHQPERVNKTR